MLDEIWDSLCDTFEYILGFEWVSDFWEAITGVFENIGEFSIFGLIFGLISAGFIYFVRDYMLNPFLDNMIGFSKIFWMVATYAACFAVGYLLGKHFEDT